MSDSAKLASLLGSRICHDLISPIGAIGNGVELVNMTARTPSPEMALIEESVTNANTRIRFFRVAFGSANAGQITARREVVEILTALGGSGRVRYDWRLEDDCDRAEAKLAFLMILCLESSLPYGGTIEVSRDGSDWIATGEAQKLKADPDLWSVVTNTGRTELTPGTVHFGLAGQEMLASGRKLTVDIAETAIRARF